MLSLIIMVVAGAASGQKIQMLDSSIKTSYRGLSVVDNKVVWASGSNGTVVLSTDGGATWIRKIVKGFEHTDFRDIEAFDKKNAIIMGVSSPAFILKTTDGGDTWKVVYENRDTAMFLDAMEFWNDMSGIVLGDPIKGKFFIGRTFDGGNTWQNIPDINKPTALEGEACFAASGTNIRKISKEEAVFVSGGMSSNFFKRNEKINLPLKQGTTTSGANSIAVGRNKSLIVVGGDFTRPGDTTGNCALSSDGGTTWSKPSIPPSGYRSCIEYLKQKKWVTCGLNGTDISEDNGVTWKNINSRSFNVVRKAKKGNSVFLAGSNGMIGKLTE